jgi:hypothetical protein
MTDVKRRFGDESGVQLEDADILRWANDGQQQIVTENKVLRAKGTLATVVGTAEYTFPAESIFSVNSIHHDGIPMRNITLQEAEETILSSDGASETGTPVVWWLWDETFTIWPTPEAAGTLTLYFTRYPTELTGDPNQVLDVSDKYYPALVSFVLQQAYEMDEDWQASQAKEAQFKTALAEQREEDFLASDNYYPTVNEVC